MALTLTRSRIDAINLEYIEPNPYQPRKRISEEVLQEMANSIKANGLLQKITLIPKMDEQFRPVQDRYYIIAGERRFRAYSLLAKEEGLQYRAIEAVIETIENLDPRGYEMKLMVNSLVENIDRVDLTPVEKAEAIMTIQKKTGKTYKEIAEVMGKSEGTIKNLMSTYKHLSSEEKEKVIKENLGMRKIKGMIDGKRSKSTQNLSKGLKEGRQAPVNKSSNLDVSNRSTEDVNSSVVDDYKYLTSEEKFNKLSLFLTKLLGTDDLNEKISFITEFVSDYSED